MRRPTKKQATPSLMPPKPVAPNERKPPIDYLKEWKTKRDQDPNAKKGNQHNWEKLLNDPTMSETEKY